MYRTLNIIALHTTRYNDRHSILAAYSREMGRVSFLVPAGNGREAARRRALLMPLSPVECVAGITHGRDIFTMRDPRATLPMHGIHADPIRAIVAMFVCEVAATVLRESQADTPTYAFLLDTAMRLNDPATPTANFPIAFLYRLGTFIGIEPDVSSWSEGRVLDLVDGTFRATPPMHPHFLPAADSRVVATLSRISWDNLGAYKFTRAERARVLDTILGYYTMHYTNLSALKSPDVLRSVLA